MGHNRETTPKHILFYTTSPLQFASGPPDELLAGSFKAGGQLHSIDWTGQNYLKNLHDTT